MRFLAPAFLALFAIPALAQVSLTDNDGKVSKGRDVQIAADGSITVQTDGAPFKVKLDGISEIQFDARQVAPAGDWEVHLQTLNTRCRDILTGSIGDPADNEHVRITGTDAGDVEFPIEFAYAFRSLKSQTAIPETPPPDDMLTWSRENKRDVDKGTVRRIAKDGIEIESKTFQSARTYKLADVDELDMAPTGKSVASEGVVVVVTTRRGLRVTGRILEMTDKVCRVETTHHIRNQAKPWELSILATQVSSIQVMNGNLAYISDLGPKLLDTWREAIVDKKEKIPAEGWFFLDRMTRSNSPIAIRNRAFRKGISTRKHVELSVELGGAFSKFTATVGVLNEATPTPLVNPSLTFKLRGDDKEIWKSPVLTFDSEPLAVAVDVKGVKTLVLVVEYEEFNDSLTYGGWGDARVVK